MTDPAGLRESYRRGHLDEDDLQPTWTAQLTLWFEQAVADPAVIEANAVQLATADAAGRPSVRTVLAKGIGSDGIVVYTNYGSQKGREAEANPYGSAVFAWLAHERQVRLTGRLTRVDRATTEAYFATRPRGSQLGAWASPQSDVVTSRAELDERLAEVTERFGDDLIPPPPDWGGLLLTPDEVEFWQGRPNRLHDRIRFRPDAADNGQTGVWVRERLAP